MSTLAKVAYLTALIFQSQQRVAIYQTNLAAADLAHDKIAARGRLADEQAHQHDLTAERASFNS